MANTQCDWDCKKEKQVIAIVMGTWGSSPLLFLTQQDVALFRVKMYLEKKVKGL